jgi:hypothetical protein
VIVTIKNQTTLFFTLFILMALLIPAASADTCSFCEFINISNITRGVTDHWFLTNRSAEDAHPQYILTAGTRAFTGKQSLGGFNLTDLLDPVAPQDAATKNYVDVVNTSMQAYVDAKSPITDHGLLSNLSGDGHLQYILTAGTRAFTGQQSMGGFNLTDLLDPVAPQDAATKNYVDAANTSMALNVSLNHASKIGGKVPTVELGSGTASSTTVLAGDQTWKPGITVLKKTSNQTINSGAGTFVDISELTFPVKAGNMYAFHYYIAFSSRVATTGWKMGVNAPNGNLDFWAQTDNIANAAVGANTHLERHNTVRDDMTLLTSTVTANVRLANRIDGIYECTQDGTFAPRFANELAADTNITVLNGSYGWYF